MTWELLYIIAGVLAFLELARRYNRYAYKKNREVILSILSEYDTLCKEALLCVSNGRLKKGSTVNIHLAAMSNEGLFTTKDHDEDHLSTERLYRLNDKGRIWAKTLADRRAVAA